MRDVWNVMKSPGSDTDPTAYSVGLSHNVQYHQALGYNATLAFGTFADALVLLANPKARTARAWRRPGAGASSRVLPVLPARWQAAALLGLHCPHRTACVGLPPSMRSESVCLSSC